MAPTSINSLLDGVDQADQGMAIATRPSPVLEGLAAVAFAPTISAVQPGNPLRFSYQKVLSILPICDVQAPLPTAAPSQAEVGLNQGKRSTGSDLMPLVVMHLPAVSGPSQYGFKSHYPHVCCPPQPSAAKAPTAQGCPHNSGSPPPSQLGAGGGCNQEPKDRHCFPHE